MGVGARCVEMRSRFIRFHIIGMNMEIIALKFKGTRTYLHGSDIYNALEVFFRRRIRVTSLSLCLRALLGIKLKC